MTETGRKPFVVCGLLFNREPNLIPFAGHTQTQDGATRMQHSEARQDSIISPKLRRRTNNSKPRGIDERWTSQEKPANSTRPLLISCI